MCLDAVGKGSWLEGHASGLFLALVWSFFFFFFFSGKRYDG